MSHQGVATTTYGYDAFGSRVFQSTGTTTTLYQMKWYSGELDGHRSQVRHDDRVHLQRRLARLHDGPADRKRVSYRHRPDPLHPPRPSRKYECRHERKWDCRADAS